MIDRDMPMKIISNLEIGVNVHPNSWDTLFPFINGIYSPSTEPPPKFDIDHQVRMGQPNTEK